MTVYGYIRVSTEKQTSANQRFEIERHLLNKGIAVDKWINETVSGTVSFKKRRLGIALRRFQKNDIFDLLRIISSRTQYFRRFNDFKPVH